MLQIGSLDDGKSEWNINETHIVIPMVDTDVIQNKDNDKISKNTITLNALDGTDQTILTSSVEHTLVIGLDRNIFDTYNNKGELLVIQNSDLKLLQSSADSKNSISYTLSFIDQPKNEVLWENSTMKSKTDWCSSEKHIVEVKDTLNYNETSKTWDSSDATKSSHPIILEEIQNMGITQTNEAGILQLHKKPDKESQFLLGFYPSVQNCEAVLPTSVISVPKTNETIKKTIDAEAESNLNELLVESNSSKWIKSETSDVLINEINKQAENISKIMRQREMTSVLKINNVQQNRSRVAESRKAMTMTTSSIPCNTSYVLNKSAGILGDNISPVVKESSSLPEKSLPLKKKAKMKSGDSNNQNLEMLKLTALRKDSGGQSCITDKSAMDSSIDETCTTLFAAVEDFEYNNISDNDSDEPLINRLNKNTKIINFKKKKKNLGNDNIEEASLKRRETWSSNNSKKIKLGNKTIENILEDDLVSNEDSPDDSHLLQFNSIQELLDDLKNKKYINDSLAEVLIAGLQEMKIDILKEMKTRRQNNTSCEYSTQLKAFALMVYFKQPAAFSYLKENFRNGWPTLAILKEWKRRLNSRRRPNYNGLKINVKEEGA